MAKLINDKLVDSIQIAINSGEVTTNSLDIFDHSIHPVITIPFGSISLRLSNGESSLIVSSDVNREYLKAWKDDVGGILLRDYKRGDMDKYFEICISNVTKCIVRKISPDEISEFSNKKKFSLITYADILCCVIKVVPFGYSYSSDSPFFDSIEESKDVTIESVDSESDEEEVETMQFADLGLDDCDEYEEEY